MCSTPFMISDLDSEESFSKEEVWNSTLYFKEIEYSDYESFANNSINYVNNELWGNLGVTVLMKDSYKKRNYEVIENYKNNLNYIKMLLINLKSYFILKCLNKSKGVFVLSEFAKKDFSALLDYACQIAEIKPPRIT